MTHEQVMLFTATYHSHRVMQASQWRCALVESLKIALKGWSPPAENNGTCLEVRSNDETIKVSGVERSELRTSAKVFITSDKKEALQEAIDKLFASLEADNIDSVVMAYTGTSHEANNRLSEIQHLWEVLEANVQSGKLSRIGISDVDTDLFITLYNSAKTKPSIVQINLASCCVVPPALQEFCKQNDIQLLTHNDPLGNFEYLYSSLKIQPLPMF
ncbi:hypothetical protein J6590_056232 [Homalodisca vitripennis]|nr:hypothetical protein J6590_056232 [Homalodisca vitripennis]